MKATTKTKLTPLQLGIQHRITVKTLRLKIEAVRSFRRWAKSNVSCLKILAKRAAHHVTHDAAKSLYAQAFDAGMQVVVTDDMLKLYTEQLEQEQHRWRHRPQRNKS